MIPLSALKKESSGFFVNNSCVFGVEFIKVVTAKAKTTSETLFVQKMNPFNEAKTYTWDIEDFSALKNLDYSPEFEVGGCKWLICMSQSHDRNHLSLYLKMKKPNDLPKDSANLVELTLCIKDQENGKHRKETGRFQASNNSPSWGWKKFISLEEFKDASKGYMIKNKCRVEAELAILGSSKME
uniref:MATH domain-containing protein n=1 Tax=Arundo donax TaxID=35708 RepID=A0A0A9EYP3_ARUDO